MMRKHFVQFLSPGTLFSETTTRPIDTWDTHLAADIARSIVERHGAKPYGFQFVTGIVAGPIPDGEGGVLAVTPKEVERSGTHYITGKLLFYNDLIGGMLSNDMRGNGWPICIENQNSYRFTNVFEDRDCIVDRDGNIVRRGDDPNLVAYREKQLADWKEGVIA